MMKLRIHAFVSGRVQGVFFRAHTKHVAQSLNLTGWVRNLPDGRVEVMAEGEEKSINKLIEFLKRGPPLARVDKLEIEKEEWSGEFIDFDIRY